ncbi:hypothetical protein CGGC5_v017224 [Colletotrichum fructicola Nara gc5]|uniref:Uncharacterized protein n=1 Tax=Colletotrichum fructicola (strain Nara gc5) TaxID=1213859 RepID=A0A7J6IDX3_COLFN|nr:hypothetical protein CGGC5_v017224 [Colletotrichum fructicola Nara gc5]
MRAYALSDTILALELGRDCKCIGHVLYIPTLPPLCTDANQAKGIFDYRRDLPAPGATSLDEATLFLNDRRSRRST